MKRKFKIATIPKRYAAPLLAPFAKCVLRRHRPRIIGVTGTAGKTTTVEMLMAILSQPEVQVCVGGVAGTIRNMNDDTGVPLTVLRYHLPPHPISRLVSLAKLPFHTMGLLLSRSYPSLLVLEYGTHDEGHLHRLVTVARPDISVLTNVGPAHLQRLGTVEGVYQEKSALVTSAAELVVTGAGHAFVDRVKRDAKAPVLVAAGKGEELSREIARIICSYLGVPRELVGSGLASYHAPVKRLEVVEVDHLTIIDDSYNANPVSMMHALDVLGEYRGRRRVAVLGRMAELGDKSLDYHREIGAYAQEKADFIVGIGDESRAYRPGQWFPDVEKCISGIGDVVRRSDIVLVKGSRSSRVWLIADHLRTR